MSKCKAIQCRREAIEGHDFCPSCHTVGPWEGFFSTEPVPTAPNKVVNPLMASYEKQHQFAQAQASKLAAVPSLAQQYPQYYKDVTCLSEVDVYAVHKLFDIQDPSGALQHASKKLLLSGVRTGGKSAYDDIREARDTLNRWLELNLV